MKGLEEAFYPNGQLVKKTPDEKSKQFDRNIWTRLTTSGKTTNRKVVKRILLQLTTSLSKPQKTKLIVEIYFKFQPVQYTTQKRITIT